MGTATFKITELNEPSETIRLENFWCRVASSHKDKWNYREHSHSFFELHLCMNGRGGFKIDKTEIDLCAGSFLLLPPGKKHQILSCDKAFEKFVWGFSVHDELVSRILADACRKADVHPVSDEMKGALRILFENADKPQFEKYPIIKHQLYYLFVLLVRSLTDLRSDTGGSAHKSSVSIDAIRNFIADNLENGISSQEIAAQFSMSERQLSRICVSEFGVTPFALKKEVQDKKIKELLLQSEDTLDEIAAKTGFSDRYTMSKFFRRTESVSPSQYRSANKNDV